MDFGFEKIQPLGLLTPLHFEYLAWLLKSWCINICDKEGRGYSNVIALPSAAFVRISCRKFVENAIIKTVKTVVCFRV